MAGLCEGGNEPPGSLKAIDTSLLSMKQYYTRKIIDCIRTLADNPELNLGNRVFIMKMHSVIHNQLSAPVYRPMLQYSWQSADYVIPKQVSDFKNVIQVAFDFSALECDSEDCLGVQRALQLQELKALHERPNIEESRTIQILCYGAS
ncbi:hypothetical protein ANN_12645 [Periplaneta americana]|uniref:Uncharacterized protein n=1 Tax=Periplaneta americana TaxID=6978 RepID=A0ABQ8TH68_PERAM|nr:hypothetical protein ANN_12645 [Periplaneta americana]